MRKHFVAATLFVVAFLAVLAFAGCGGTVDPQADAYKTVVKWTTAIQKGNFYDACAYEVYDGKYNVTQKQLDDTGLGKTYTARRYCAQQWAGSGVTVASSVVQEQPVTVAHRPRNDGLIEQAQFYLALGIIDTKTYREIIASAKAHDEKLRPPKNGYIFRVSVKDQGDAYVSVQRDSHGDWKIVGVQ